MNAGLRKLRQQMLASGYPERAERYFQPQDFTDLQVLSQIAWFDEFFLEEKDIAALIAKGRSFTLDFSLSRPSLNCMTLLLGGFSRVSPGMLNYA